MKSSHFCRSGTEHTGYDTWRILQLEMLQKYKQHNKLIQSYKNTTIFFSCDAATQRGSWPHSWGFLDHTQRHTTVGRSSLDKWSVRRRDLYLTIHNTHNRQTSVPPLGLEPTISEGERPQTYALDCAAIGTGKNTTNKNPPPKKKTHCFTHQSSKVARTKITSFIRTAQSLLDATFGSRHHNNTVQEQIHFLPLKAQ
jgi:hypothetical protein